MGKRKGNRVATTYNIELKIFLPPKNLHHHFIHSEGMNSLVDLRAGNYW